MCTGASAIERREISTAMQSVYRSTLFCTKSDEVMADVYSAFARGYMVA